MIDFQIQGSVAIATLNRPAALNSLNLEMVQSLATQLPQWLSDPRVSALIIRGAGPKAFCAGGDVKTVCQNVKRGDLEYGINFFRTEYEADLMIHSWTKPVVCVGHGIVMGGGIGLFAGAALRVSTPSSVFAMPEISIGLFPDVGGSFFLNRMPGKTGLFLALTGARFNATDAQYLGLSNAFVSDDATSELVQTLVDHRWSLSSTENRRYVQEFGDKLTSAHLNLRPPSQIEPVAEQINQTLSHDSRLELFSALSELCTSSTPWLSKAASSFRKGSPTSAHLIVEQLTRGRTLPLNKCFEMELKMAIACCKHHDFYEGVRAVLIDKDQAPQWAPNEWADIPKQLIDEHFE